MPLVPLITPARIQLRNILLVLLLAPLLPNLTQATQPEVSSNTAVKPTRTPVPARTLAKPPASASSATPVSSPPEAGEWAQLFKESPSAEQLPIRNLQISKRYLPVEEVDEQLTATFDAVFQDPDYSLLYNNEHIKAQKESGRFQLKIPLKAERTRFVLNAVTPQGKVQTSTFVISYAGYLRFVQKIAEYRKLLAAAQNRPRWSAGLGYSSIDFSQTDLTPMKQSALTAKFGWTGMLKVPRWDLGITTFVTAATLTTTRKDLKVTFLGVNGRVGYIVPFVLEPWKLSLMGGYYYTTMFVSGGQLGYRNLQGPMAFPVLRRAFTNGMSVSGYFKFSPITDRLSILSMSNHEIAGGLSVARPLGKRYGLGVSLDLSKFSFSIGKTSIVNSTTTFGIGLSF